MLSIEMFPAACGDALWMEYGDTDKPRRILVDGGTLSAVDLLAERIRAVAVADPSGSCVFELAVLTHIDGDHIEGFLSLVHHMTEGKLPMQVSEIWFNGAPHLPDPDQDEEPPPPGANSPDHFGPLAGDAFARDTAAAVRRLLDERAPVGGRPDRTLARDALKVAHHGSRNNISEDLVAGGRRRDPNTRAARPAHVHFNYRCPLTLRWNGKDNSGKLLATKFNFKPNYPRKGKEGMRVVLGE